MAPSIVTSEGEATTTQGRPRERRKGSHRTRRPPTWEGPVFFHYTRPDYAAVIFDERTYTVSSRADLEYGTGFWVTDIAPDTMSEEEIHATLLPHQPIEYTHGVVVIIRHPDFRRVREHEFLLEGAPDSDVDLREMAVAVGRRTAAGWVFRSDPLT